MSDDTKLRERLEEDAARETGAVRALRVLEAMRSRAEKVEEWPVLEIIDAGLLEVRTYIAEDAKRPGYWSDRATIERITVQRDNAEAKAADLESRLELSRQNERVLVRRAEYLLVRLKEAEERIPPSNASEMAPEPPALPNNLDDAAQVWNLVAKARRQRDAAWDENVLTQDRLDICRADLEAMRKRAESAERTLELIKENLS